MSKKKNTVSIHMNEQSKPVIRKNVINSYTKGGMYCILIGTSVEKYPLCNIFRVVEDY